MSVKPSNYEFNGLNTYQAYNLVITDGKNTFEIPRERKDPYSFDWPDENGIEYDLSAVYFKPRVFKLSGWIWLNSVTAYADFKASYDALKALFESPGYFTVTSGEFDEQYNVFCSGYPKYDRKTRLQEGNMIAVYLEVELKEIIGGEFIETPQTPQSITFPDLPGDIDTDSPDFSPGAVATSGLTVVYASSNSAVAIIINGKIHVTGVGTAVITARQPGNNVYYAAAPVTKTLTVAQGTVINNAFTYTWPFNFS